METTSFISTKVATKLLKALTQVLKNSVDKRNKELVRINDVFGNCEELAKFYIQPDCQQVNPADELEDETISSIRAGVFETINKFFNRDIVTRDGASQMFILADAGMGKTSLLMMVKLSHLMAFWPKNYECKLLKLGATTLSDIDKIENKSQTVLLLDSLDEDTQCKQGGTIERLTKILEATSCFYRVVITCRTQFFPETAGSAFNTMGKISFNNYDCPLVYLSLFTDEQVDAYLDKRYPRSLKYLFNQFYNPKLHDAKQSIRSIGSLQFRPFLLSHVETLLESHRQGATEYELYKGLVDTWLNREIIKLRKYHDKKINKEDLLKACIWLAETMQRQGTHTVALKHIQQLCHCESHIILLNDSADRVIEGIDHIDIGTNSLLNRNSYGEFRFSHLSIREFLIVYGVELGILVDRGDPFHKTDNMLKFIKTVNKYKVGLFSNEKNGYLLTGFKLLEGSQLSGFDLTYASLEQSDLRKAVLNGIKLEGANLQGANLDGANLERANLKGANLQGASLQGANLQGANLQDASLHKAHLNGAILDNANLNCATLTGAQLTILKSSQDNITTLKNADLRMADLSEANLEGADLTKVCLTSAKLQASLCSRTNFSKASLDSADFKSSIFINANFEKADLTQADFGGCDFTNANLQGAELSGCDLTQARLTSSNITDSQRGVAIFRKYKNEKRNELVE
ncbi:MULTISPECIES: pentapeptide repeat-containing protein [Vibrio]|uniref:pentapeptide repeat-containing protein n=1 Tax=Vibrio TaxID=662 RepID=UPI0002EF09B0|nr:MULTISPECIES: pentapeptide repeat-containing protein [Vibrio]AQM20606.1 effector protein PipB [Vibrio anguillarum]AUB86520.1 effector protein PipB [Vibrio anguillarum]AUB89960.1 effector protein PipB [Vibrio anguillarum]AUB93401.1 effector protein PipB [Vibrio anguillarum]AUB96833.1 effector protein PipB [Vibrio anguillarum]